MLVTAIGYFGDISGARVLDLGCGNGSSSLFFSKRGANVVVGKYGIPKGGDDEEFPLMPQEVGIIKKYFSVKIVYPELLFFRLASQYLLKRHLHKFTRKLDDYLFQFPRFRQYSYRPNVFLS